MKALITGGAGFIGSHLAHELLGRGHAVRILDDLSSGTLSSLERMIDDDHAGYLGFIEGGVAEEQALRRSLAGVDTVFHLATRAQVPANLESPADAFASDVAGTFRLLEEARHRRLRLVLLSSCSVYGESRGAARFTEDDPPRPASPHAGCKLAAEALCLSYGRGFGLPVTVVRPVNVYGPGQRADTAGGVVAIFCQRAQLGLPILVHGSGEQTRDLLYVGDCVRLLCDASSNPAEGELLNAATGIEVSMNELADRVRRAPFAHPTTRIDHVDSPSPRVELGGVRCDASRATRLLGWRPQVSLDEGLARTAAFFRHL